MRNNGNRLLLHNRCREVRVDGLHGMGLAGPNAFFLFLCGSLWSIATLYYISYNTEGLPSAQVSLKPRPVILSEQRGTMELWNFLKHALESSPPSLTHVAFIFIWSGTGENGVRTVLKNLCHLKSK